MENLNPPPAPPLAASRAEQSISESADGPLLNPDDGVDLIGDSTSWPSLSESARSSPPLRSAPATEYRIVASKAPEASNSPQNHIHHNTNATPNPNSSVSSNSNHQRSSGRGRSGRGGTSRGGFIRHPVPPQQLPSPPPLPPVFHSGFEVPIRGPFFYGNGFAHPRPSIHQFQQASSSHRGRGRHHNYANYRGLNWNAFPQALNSRDVRFSPPGPPMVYLMPPQQPVPFPFMHGPMPPPDILLGMTPYAGGSAPVPPPSLSSPFPDNLQTKLLNQINYYFSEENLVKDMYLRSKMDDGGWVPVGLIANFKKVRDFTQDMHLVRESLEASTVVEVQGDKMRRRNDWKRWIPASSITEGPTTELDSVIDYFRNATLDVHADRSYSSATNASPSPRKVLT